MEEIQFLSDGMSLPMKDIKRYSDTVTYDKDETYYTMTLCDNGNYVQFSDHKAVVQTKDKQIAELENTKVKGNCNCSIKQMVIAAQKNKIEKLERYLNSIEEQCDKWNRYGKKNQCIDSVYNIILKLKEEQ